VTYVHANAAPNEGATPINFLVSNSLDQYGLSVKRPAAEAAGYGRRSQPVLAAKAAHAAFGTRAGAFRPPAIR